MQAKVRKLLLDVVLSCEELSHFVQYVSFDDFRGLCKSSGLRQDRCSLDLPSCASLG